MFDYPSQEEAYGSRSRVLVDGYRKRRQSASSASPTPKCTRAEELRETELPQGSMVHHAVPKALRLD
eukprot:3553646-Amphidinium_carterae.1